MCSKRKRKSYILYTIVYYIEKKEETHMHAINNYKLAVLNCCCLYMYVHYLSKHSYEYLMYMYTHTSLGTVYVCTYYIAATSTLYSNRTERDTLFLLSGCCTISLWVKIKNIAGKDSRRQKTMNYNLIMPKN